MDKKERQEMIETRQQELDRINELRQALIKTLNPEINQMLEHIGKKWLGNEKPPGFFGPRKEMRRFVIHHLNGQWQVTMWFGSMVHSADIPNFLDAEGTVFNEFDVKNYKATINIHLNHSETGFTMSVYDSFSNIFGQPHQEFKFANIAELQTGITLFSEKLEQFQKDFPHKNMMRQSFINLHSAKIDEMLKQLGTKWTGDSADALSEREKDKRRYVVDYRNGKWRMTLWSGTFLFPKSIPNIMNPEYSFYSRDVKTHCAIIVLDIIPDEVPSFLVAIEDSYINIFGKQWQVLWFDTFPELQNSLNTMIKI